MDMAYNGFKKGKSMICVCVTTYELFELIFVMDIYYMV